MTLRMLIKPCRCSAGGIGNALARAFHARGLRVFATARSLEKMSDLKSDLGIECLSLDVKDLASVSICFAEVEKRVDGKGLDYLVNNAGVGTPFSSSPYTPPLFLLPPGR